MSASNEPSPATRGLRVQVCAVSFQAVNISSRPSRNPSPSVSGFVGSVVHPETLIKSCPMNEPKDSVFVIPDHCCKVKPAPTVVTYHCGLERFAFVSDNAGSILLYSSQLLIPSSSESSHLSLEFNGSSDHFASSNSHLANQISQPSGIPSESLSASVGSPVCVPSPKLDSGAPQSEMFLNKSVEKLFGIISPSKLMFPLNKSSRM